MASSDHIHVYSLFGSLSKDDDATAIKCRDRGWRRVTFQTTTTTAENWVSVKRGVGVYLFFTKKNAVLGLGLGLTLSLTTGDPGSVIVPQYGSSKITVFVWGKNTILKFRGNTK